MIAGPRLKELIETLFEVDPRSACHVIEVITLAIPRKRRSHRGPITGVKEIIRPGEVLRPGKRRRGVTKVCGVIVKKISAMLSPRTAREGCAHRKHRLHSGSLNAQQAYAPFWQRVVE